MQKILIDECGEITLILPALQDLHESSSAQPLGQWDFCFNPVEFSDEARLWTQGCGNSHRS